MVMGIDTGGVQKGGNPFFPKEKRKTVRRDAKEVYPDLVGGKGLKKPQYQANGPLDRVFIELEPVLEGEIGEVGVETMYQRIFGNDESFGMERMEIEEMGVDKTGLEEMRVEKMRVEKMGIENNGVEKSEVERTGIDKAGIEKTGTDKTELEKTVIEKRLMVVERLLDYLVKIQTVCEAEVVEDKNLIKISLHDMKTFSKLFNVILLYGVYPAFEPFRIGIPFNKRRLKGFTKSGKSIAIDKLPFGSTAQNKFGNHEKLLEMVYVTLLQLFSIESDVTDLLSRGTGISDLLTISIALITVPYFKVDKDKYQREFDEKLLPMPETYELFSTFTLLLSDNPPAYFKQFVSSYLQLLPYKAPRKDGVLKLIEFVLGLRENEEVDVEKFDQVANVILLKPKAVNTVVYFTSIGLQFHDLLGMVNRPLVTSCVSYVIERLWNKNKLVVCDFILRKIWDSFSPPIKDKHGPLVTETQLNNNINILLSFSRSGLSAEFLHSIIEPILLPLWAYNVFLKKSGKSAGIIDEIVVSYFKTMKESNIDVKAAHGLEIISKNLLYEGENHWEYNIGPNDLVEIIDRKVSLDSYYSSNDNRINKAFGDIECQSKYFVEILKQLDDDLVLKVFIEILKRWLKLDNDNHALETPDPLFVMIDLRLLENIGTSLRSSLINTPNEMLTLLKTFLIHLKDKDGSMHTSKDNSIDHADSDDEDEDDVELSSDLSLVILELLSTIVCDLSSANLDQECSELLSDISTILSALGENHSQPQGARDSYLSLRERTLSLLHGERPTMSKKELETKTLSKAVASLDDPLVPVRAHGLYLLRQLIELKSESISVNFVINLHLTHLKDPDPFIYLSVIKSLESLIELDQDRVLSILLDIYVGTKATVADLDDRLKVGEVLLRSIDNGNEVFTATAANSVVKAALSLVRRSDNNEEADLRIRMSSMSILGVCCKTNPLGIASHLHDALDCAVGILQLESSSESSILRRAAIHLIHDLIIGTSSSDLIEFPLEYKEKILILLKYIAGSDKDLLAREQATSVLDTIDELVKEAFTTTDTL